MSRIDLNCDMGEYPEAIENGSQEAIMPFLSSVNIACGGHAGDDATMNTTIGQAQRWNLAVGAHPGYPDRQNFGRIAIDMPRGAIAETVYQQVRTLAEIAARRRVVLRHVKAHGALYNSAAANAGIAESIAQGVAQWGRELVLVGLAGSVMLDVFQAAGFRTAGEAFADRRYEPNGSLRARGFPDALITDAAAAAQQVIDLIERGSVTAVDGTKIAVQAATICIHGDTPGAGRIAAEVSRTLIAHGIELHSL